MTDSNDLAIKRVWLSVDEVQQMTGVSRTEIYAALQTRELVGNQRTKHKKWRIHIDAINAWMRGDTAISA